LLAPIKVLNMIENDNKTTILPKQGENNHLSIVFIYFFAP